MIEAKGIYVASYLPSGVLTNEEIESWGVNKETNPGKNPRLLTASGIEDVTGIKVRYIAPPLENSITMGARAIDSLPIEARNIDALLVSGTFPMGRGIAQGIAAELGANIDIRDLMNVHKACSGVGDIFSYIAEHEGRFWGRNVVIVASEKYSPHLVDLREENAVAQDPSMSQVIFSDAAATMSGTYGIDFRVLGTSFRDFPDQKDLITLPVDEYELRGPFRYYHVPRTKKVIQKGRDVLKLVTKNVPDQIVSTIDSAEVAWDDVDHIIPHQASVHIVDNSIAEQLPDVLKEKVVKAYQDGNMSSASVLWALEKISDRGIVRGKIIDFPTFGAGPISINALVEFY